MLRKKNKQGKDTGRQWPHAKYGGQGRTQSVVVKAGLKEVGDRALWIFGVVFSRQKAEPVKEPDVGVSLTYLSNKTGGWDGGSVVEMVGNESWLDT